ncbi:proteasome subunit beta type-2-like [Leptopilina heterotoma]|uniref:proteasome subunit beta type-2-like n=1 Tax=Leptopilina heterotoma TaxID=63436 RepID=UPI001CA9DB82|nr:proteasome subunit beta type-2-like [Leptopilina heterotoma]
MECSIGIQFKDFVLVAADMTNTMSILVLKSDEKKIYKISEKVIMAVSGEAGDSVQFSEYISKNMQLYKMRNGYELSPKAVASYTRRNLADYLRSRTPYNVNLLLAGHDDETGPELYFIDYLAACVKVPYASHGYGGFFSLTILDRLYDPSMSEAEAYELMKTCVREIHKRLIVNLPNFKVQKVSKDGITELAPIMAQNLAVENAAKA